MGIEKGGGKANTAGQQRDPLTEGPGFKARRIRLSAESLSKSVVVAHWPSFAQESPTALLAGRGRSAGCSSETVPLLGAASQLT